MFLHIVDTPLTSWNRSSCLELCLRFWNRSLSPLTLRLGLFVFPPVYLKERYNAAKHRVLIINQCLIPQQTEFGERLGVSIHFICRTVVPMGSFLYDLCCLLYRYTPTSLLPKKDYGAQKIKSLFPHNQKSVSTHQCLLVTEGRYFYTLMEISSCSAFSQGIKCDALWITCGPFNA